MCGLVSCWCRGMKLRGWRRGIVCGSTGAQGIAGVTWGSCNISPFSFFLLSQSAPNRYRCPLGRVPRWEFQIPSVARWAGSLNARATRRRLINPATQQQNEQLRELRTFIAGACSRKTVSAPCVPREASFLSNFSLLNLICFTWQSTSPEDFTLFQ